MNPWDSKGSEGFTSFLGGKFYYHQFSRKYDFPNVHINFLTLPSSPNYKLLLFFKGNKLHRF